jgi:hypothetical protein
VVIAQLAPELTEDERGVFCLQTDAVNGFSGLAVGPRTAYGLCEKPGRACQIVNATRDEATELAGAATQAGIEAARHRSGALVMSGSTTGLASAMGSVGTAVAGVMSAPLALAGAAASVVVVGGAVWVCSG